MPVITYRHVIDMRSHKPFFLFFKFREAMAIFNQQYDLGEGFGIWTETNRNGSPRYCVCTNSYIFTNVIVFEKNNMHPGLYFTGNARPITQKRTMEAAQKQIRVIHFERKYISVLGENPYLAEEQNGTEAFVRLLSVMQGERQSAASGLGQNDEEHRWLDYLDEQEALIEKRSEYEQTHLFSVRYKRWREVTGNATDGAYYEFEVDLTENEMQDDESINSRDEKLIEKTNSGAALSIPRTTLDAQGNPLQLNGTLCEVNNNGEELWLKIKVNRIEEAIEIAKTGILQERENPEYGYKLNAIRRMRSKLSPNQYLLPILAEQRVRPITELVAYSTEYDNAGNRLRESQKKAIQMALSTEDFLLVQGPPGTGKTTIITEMLQCFVTSGLRVLICSKNNLAVDNVLEKSSNLFYDTEKQNKMQCLRLGNEEKVLESVRSVLPRSLTLTIQNEVKEASEQARQNHAAKTAEILHICKTAREETRILCGLMAYFLQEKRSYGEYAEAFANSGWKAFLGRQKRESFERVIRGLLDEADGILTDLTALLRMKQAAFNAESVQRCCYRAAQMAQRGVEMCDELTKYRLRYSMIFGQDRDGAIEKANQSTQVLPAILKDIQRLREYKGNPVADRMQSINTNISMLDDKTFLQYQREINGLLEQLPENQKVIASVLDDWHEDLKNDQKSLEEPLLQSVKIIGATCIGVCTNRNFSKAEYDIAIVDEAGQITMHDVMVPLEKAKKVILIGDHLQLPPTGEREFCDYLEQNDALGFAELEEDADRADYRKELEKIFSVSLFEKLFRSEKTAHNRVMLNEQFRMHPDIAEFISDTFYGGAYISGISAETRMLKIAGFTHPIYFIDTAGEKRRKEDANADKKIHTNKFEAMLCGHALAGILEAIEDENYQMANGERKLKNEDNGSYDIGVITAYKAQIPLLRKAIVTTLQKQYNKSKPEAESMADRLAINTLDSFQGRDNQIIFYSFVRSNSEHNIGFQNEVRRLNVMMTRAKSLLVMVGDSETLTKTKARTVHDNKPAAFYYSRLIDYCKKKTGYMTAAELLAREEAHDTE